MNYHLPNQSEKSLYLVYYRVKALLGSDVRKRRLVTAFYSIMPFAVQYNRIHFGKQGDYEKISVN